MSGRRSYLPSDGTGVDLATLVEIETAPFATATTRRVTWSGPAVVLPVERTQGMAMMLHELATNAAKYGALSVESGRVAVTWCWREQAVLELVWSETGGPVVSPPSRRGLGTGVIEGSLHHGMNEGNAEFDWRPEGLTCRLQIPLIPQ